MQAFKTYLKSKAGLSEEEFFEIGTDKLETKTFDKGAFLLQAGDICNCTFFVEKGVLRLYSIDDIGKEHIIQFAPEDWLINDRSSTYFNEPSEFFIDAIENTAVVVLNKDFFNKAAKTNEKFRKYFDAALQNHIRHIHHRLNFLLGASAEKKYMDFIHLYPDLTLRIPQWMIASYLGITPEGLSRVRKNLAEKNFKP